MILKRLRRMSPSHQATAKMLLAHFARVLAHSDKNKMSSQALTLCLNPVLFPMPDEGTLTAATTAAQAGRDRCLDFLIKHRQDLFSGLPVLGDSNNPYRNAHASSADFDDEDPAWRKSQESVRLGSGHGHSNNPPSSATFAAPASMPLHHSNLVSAPMLYSSSEGSSSSSLSIPLANSSPARPMDFSPNGSWSATATLEKAYTMSPPSNDGQSLPPSHQSSGTASPRRSFSQRARSGSQTIANAVRNSLARAKSPTGTSFSGPTQGPWQSPGPMSPSQLNLGSTAGGATSPLREAASFDWEDPPPTPATVTASTHGQMPHYLRPQHSPQHLRQASPEPLAAGTFSPTFGNGHGYTSSGTMPYGQGSYPATHHDVLPAGAALYLPRPASMTTRSASASGTSLIDPDNVYTSFHRTHP